MTLVKIRRSMVSYQIAETDSESLHNMEWRRIPGGNQIPMPDYCISAIVPQEEIHGEVAHSGMHREEWMNHEPLRVVILKKDNDPHTYMNLKSVAGPKPGKEKRIWAVISTSLSPWTFYSIGDIAIILGAAYSDGVVRRVLHDFSVMGLLAKSRKKQGLCYMISDNNHSQE